MRDSLIEYFTDSSPDYVNHIKVDHRIAEAFIAVVSLWSMCSKSLLHCAWNEAASVGIIQESRILHKVDSLLQGIILMGYTIVQNLAHRVVVVLLHHVGEESSPGHLTHSQVANLCQNLIYRQDEWSGKVFIIHHILLLITKRPCHTHNGRTEFKNKT